MSRHHAEQNPLSLESKRAFLADLLRKRIEAPRKSAPLSSGQKALLFLSRSAPENPFYNTFFAFRIRSAVSVDAMRTAFAQLVDRHGSLRTVFSVDKEDVVQIVGDEAADGFSRFDASTWSLEQLRGRAAEAHRKPFDLQQGPLARASLFTRAADDHVLLISIHHIAYDGWSLWLLLDEFSRLYEFNATGKNPALPLLRRTYHDFVQWQAVLLASPEGEILSRFWVEQLGGHLPRLNLPTDFARPRVPTYRGDALNFRLGAVLIRRLEEMSRANGVTLYATLLAGFAALLHRYAAQDEIIIGTLAAGSNRSDPDFAGVVGYFANLLPIKSVLTADIPCSEYLRQIYNTSLEALVHQDYPFSQMVERLRVERELGRTPIFDVMFTFQRPQVRADLAPFLAPDGNVERIEFGGLHVEPFDVPVRETRFDLCLDLSASPDAVVGQFQYASDLFKSDTIERLASQYRVLLQAMAADGSRSIADAPLASVSERDRLILESRGPELDVAADASLQRMFELAARDHGGNTPIQLNEHTLSFADLNRRANRLAHYLRGRGIGPDTIVGVAIDRSIDMMVGLLAIAKAGGAYLPLDPEFPDDRLNYMIADAKCRLLLTQHHDLARWTASDAAIVSVDDCWPDIERESDEDPSVFGNGNTLAYVIYTSGSTGRPKGVPISRRSLANFLLGMVDVLKPRADDVFLAVTTLSFDIAALELYLPLIIGARLVIAKHDEAADGLRLRRLLDQVSAAFMQATPATWQLLLGAGWRGDGKLTVLVGGEALPWRLADQLHRENKAVWNLYGPTETTIWSTAYQIRELHDKNERREGVVPIGKPLPNAQVYVLDRNLQPVPIGISGEIHIGGDGVAHGYLGRPDLTDERFIADPFNSRDGARLYRTGDLGRLRADGNIEFLGRVDSQIKMRGFRIEPGEIEAAMQRNAAVGEAVVIARADAEDDARLVAYVVPKRRVAADSKQKAGSDATTDHVENWRAVWNATYRRPPANFDPTFNIVGWRDSYTGEPFSSEEMRAWVDNTVEGIARFAPRRIMDVGCGTGLLLHRLAPHCAEYHGLDISPEAIAQLRQSLDTCTALQKKTKLAVGSAVDFDRFEADSFDAVLFNSVVQYFPSPQYLTAALSGWAEKVAPGGMIFVGDVRSRPLFEAFHWSVITRQAGAQLSAGDLAARLDWRLAQETELVLDPGFFAVIRQQIPRVSNVLIQIKKGRDENELIKYRYDVVLEIGGEPAERSRNILWFDCRRDPVSLEALRRLLGAPSRPNIGLQNVGDLRVKDELDSLRKAVAEKEHRDVLPHVACAPPIAHFHPENLRDLAHAHSYRAYIGGPRAHVDGCYDVVFQNEQAGPEGRPSWPVFADPCEEHTRPLANDPLQARFEIDLTRELRSFADEVLPRHMRPSSIVILNKLPRTLNGKIDRRTLPAPFGASLPVDTVYVPPATDIEQRISAIWRELLRVDKVGVLNNFFDLGGHSLLAMKAQAMLSEEFKREFSAVTIFEYPTVKALAAYLAEEAHAPAKQESLVSPVVKPARGKNSGAVSVIGLAGRFPGSPNIDVFWRNLVEGVESISFFSDAQLRAAGVGAEVLSDPLFVRAGSILEDADKFDADLFGYSTREACLMDPQHRVFLECAWEAMEQAGYDGQTYPGKIGVFAGAALNTYALECLVASRAARDPVAAFQFMIANDKDYLTTRVSYKMDLKGPSITVQTACSTSLVAVHLACQSLLSGECDIGLAGGVAVHVPQVTGYSHRDGMILSPDGHCRVFDAMAAGTVPASGVGIVLLKRLEEALADGDQIYAVVRGSAVNNDGSTKVGYTAPSVAGQAAVITEALAKSGSDARTITYVEAHGTGTALGDPVEVAALTRAYRRFTNERGFCALGSVKTNVGHLDAAAGIAGFIKTTLAVQTGLIPPTLHYSQPNPKIDFDNSPFFVNSKLSQWETGGQPRRAGVSAFGIGGSNAHVILEQAPPRQAAQPVPLDRPVHVLCLSAKGEAPLTQLIDRYRAFFDNNPDVNLGDVCFTASTGRRQLSHRVALIASTASDMRQLLADGMTARDTRASVNIISGVVPSDSSAKVAFVFGDDESSLVSIARELYQTQPGFRRTLIACDSSLDGALGENLFEILYPDAPRSTPQQLASTDAALFAVRYALAELWRAWGVEPAVVTGKGIGEYAAACFAGVFSLKEGLRLAVERRNALQQSRFAPTNAVGSAFERFTQVAREIHYAAPRIPCVAGNRGVDAKHVTSVGHWLGTLTEPTRWKELIEAARGTGCNIFVGLGGLPDRCNQLEALSAGSDTSELWLQSLRPDMSDWSALLHTLAALWIRGANVDWRRFESDYPRRRISLPTYPFQRKKFWIGAPADLAVEASLVSAPPRSVVAHLDGISPQQVVPEVHSQPDEYLTEAEISQHGPFHFSDHRVRGTAVVPAAYFLHVARAATEKSLKQTIASIKNVVFERALSVAADRHVLQCVLQTTHRSSAKFELRSRPEESAAPWKRHVSGDVGGFSEEETRSLPCMTDLTALKQRMRDYKLSVSWFYEQCRSMDIDYGPNYALVEDIWGREGEALGLVRSAQSSGEVDGQLDPISLDACLQVVAAALPDFMRRKTMLPAALDHFAIWTTAGRVWSHVRLISADSREDAQVDIDLYADDGRRMGFLNGFRLRAARTEIGAEDAPVWADWLYQPVWEAKPHIPVSASGFALLPRELAQKLGSKQREIENDEARRSYTRALRALDELAVQCARQTFLRLGWQFRPQERFSTDEAMRRLRVVAGHRPLLERMLDMLAQAGDLTRDDVWRSNKALAAEDLQSKFDEATLTHPMAGQEVGLLRRIGLRLAQILTGELTGLEVLFPNGDLSALRQFYETAWPARVMNQLVASGLEQLSARFGFDRELRIVEIGAGTGSTTSHVLPALRSDHVKYVFTDVSPMFLNNARARFGQGDRMNYRALDIERSLDEQGFEPASFDIVIATNVLHATSDLREAVGRARELLRPGGWLLVSEAIRPQRWIDLVFGTTSGWWRFQDRDLRPAHPLISMRQWRHLLGEAGFAAIDAVGSDSEEQERGSGQALLLAMVQEHGETEPAWPGRALILADCRGAGNRFADMLAAAGVETILVTMGDRFARTSSHAYTIRPDEPGDFERLLAEATTSAVPLDSVVSFLAMDAALHPAMNEETLKHGLLRGLGGALNVARALARAERTRNARLWLVTHGAQAVAEDREVPEYVQAAVCGFAKAAANEHPELRITLIDMDPGALERSLGLLAGELRTNSQEREIAFRGEQRFVSRLMRRAARNARPSGPPKLDPAGSYLITGGTGGLGLAVAEWLVRQGARHLFLVGRDATRACQADLDSMTRSGARIRVIAADVSVREQMLGVMREIESGPAPLKGVVHAAGVLSDAALIQQSWERFSSVLGPKVFGAWNLHSLTSNERLDFFVSFSSIASLLGFRGQTNHSAANAFLDALTRFRRAAGLAGTSINWGPWSEIGAAAGHAKRERSIAGIGQIRPSEGLDVLGWILAQQITQVGVFRVDWSAYWNSETAMPFLEHFAPARAKPNVRASSHSISLKTVIDQDRRSAVHRRIASEVGAILGTDMAELGPQIGLFDLGLDSLAAIDLRRRLEKALGCSLPATLIFKYPTIEALVDFFLIELDDKSPADAQPGVGHSRAFEPPAADRPFAASTEIITNGHHESQKSSERELDEMTERELADILVRELEGLQRHAPRR